MTTLILGLEAISLAAYPQISTMMSNMGISEATAGCYPADNDPDPSITNGSESVTCSLRPKRVTQSATSGT